VGGRNQEVQRHTSLGTFSPERGKGGYSWNPPEKNHHEGPKDKKAIKPYLTKRAFETRSRTDAARLKEKRGDAAQESQYRKMGAT